MTTKKVKFQFSGKMARLLGRESVSSDIAALFELVKNGYDADAEKVDVIFENFLPEGGKNGRIIVQDTGTGMTVDDIEKKWMIIGTDTKERSPTTKIKKRRMIGNKGVGRFSTEKLAKQLVLISKPSESNDEITLKINWEDYEKQDVTFNDVSFDLAVAKRDNKNDIGVTIILSSLREPWTAVKVDRLRLALSSLVLPRELAVTSGDKFEINVIANEFETELPTKLQSLLLKYAPYKLIATMAQNSFTGRVAIRREGQVIRNEQIDFSETVMENGDQWKPFGNCKLTLYFFPGESRYEDWNRYYKKVLNLSKIQNTLADIHGTKIYRDGFWVRPYGDMGDDWLGLEQERVQANYKIGNSQVIGFVQITKDDNPTILDTTTRERLVENTAFHSMRTFVKEAIEILNNHRWELNKQLKEKQVKKHHQNMIESEVKNLQVMIEKNPSLHVEEKKQFKQALKGISQIFADFEKETEQELNEKETYQRAYRNLASLGISSATTAHEIGHVMGHLGLIPKVVLNKLKKESEARQLIQEDLDSAIDKINTVRYFMQFIIRFVSNLSYDNEMKHEKERIILHDTLHQFKKDFSGITKMHGISVEIHAEPDNLAVHMNRADFLSIILNLFSNSLKALKKMPSGAPRTIRVTMNKDSKVFSMRFSDSGSGVNAINRDKIFRLFFTTNKQGTGLGLPITKEILEDYGGTIELAENSEIDKGATFVVSIPLAGIKE